MRLAAKTKAVIFGIYGGLRRQKRFPCAEGFAYTHHEITAHRIMLATVMLDSEYVAKDVRIIWGTGLSGCD